MTQAYSEEFRLLPSLRVFLCNKSSKWVTVNFVWLGRKDWGHHFSRTSAHTSRTPTNKVLSDFSRAHKLVLSLNHTHTLHLYLTEIRVLPWQRFRICHIQSSCLNNFVLKGFHQSILIHNQTWVTVRRILLFSYSAPFSHHPFGHGGQANSLAGDVHKAAVAAEIPWWRGRKNLGYVRQSWTVRNFRRQYAAP